MLILKSKLGTFTFVLLLNLETWVLPFEIVEILILTRYLWNCSNTSLSLPARREETINHFIIQIGHVHFSRIIQRRRMNSIYYIITYILLTIFLPLIIVRICKSLLTRIPLKSFEYSNSREIKNYFKYIFTFLVLSRNSSSGSIFEVQRSSLLIEIRVHKTGRESGKQSGGTK